MEHLDFLRREFGGRNWVLARRSASITRRYGDDVICVSHKQYALAEHKYRAEYGDPYDKPRANLYIALMKARAHISLCSKAAPSPAIALLQEIDAALEAERNAR